jgi:hypothetical protein
VRSSLRAGKQTETVPSRPAASDRGSNCRWWNVFLSCQDWAELGIPLKDGERRPDVPGGRAEHIRGRSAVGPGAGRSDEGDVGGDDVRAHCADP